MTIDGGRARDPSPAIQGLWIGTHLSALERLSIRSFLQNGHEYHLYAYGEVRNLPDGTTVRDGREILPESRIFQYRDHKSFSAFSNFFRYKLLLDREGGGSTPTRSVSSASTSRTTTFSRRKWSTGRCWSTAVS